MSSVSSGLFLAGFPRASTSFVGREREIATLAVLLRREDVRLLSLTGTGGVGKTRLALRVAEEVAGAFDDGVVFVSLAGVGDAELVARTIARALSLHVAGDVPPVDQLTVFLRPRILLILLDTFEHVMSAAPVLADLLAAAPGLKLLVTTRSMLRLSGERVFTVAPLGLPDVSVDTGRPLAPGDLTGGEAVRLFIERAQAARSDFVLTAENAAAVAEICLRLDGLPLAIELAAARVASLPPATLLRRMDRRLPLLTSGTRDAPTRQQTMRAALAWSHDLLTLDERTLFRRLAVFAGGFTLDAAEAVAGARGSGLGAGELADKSSLTPNPEPLAPSVLDGITALVEHSLVGRATHIAGDARYAMLDTIREFGLEQLTASEEEADVREAFAAYVLDWAEETAPRLIGPDQVAWIDRIERELPNIRAALDWLRDRGRAEEGLRLAAAPGRFWWRRGYLSEGRAWLDAFLALPAPGGGSRDRVRALLVAGDIAAWQKDVEQAVARHGEAGELARTLGDGWGLAMALFGLGSDEVDRDALAAAAPLLAESVATFRDVGDAWGAALAMSRQGEVAAAQGDYARAAECLETALAAFRACQDGRFVAGVLDGLGRLALLQDDAAGARRAFAESLAISISHGDRTTIAWVLMGMAGTAGLSGRAETAARLLSAAAALRESLGARLGPLELAIHGRIEDRARAALGTAAFAAAWESGADLPVADAIAEATAVAGWETLETDRALAPPGDRSPSLPGGLSPRQVDVLRLMADGLSDTEIAWQLQISPRTASNHVAAVFAKLNVHTRQSAVQAASRLGLV